MKKNIPAALLFLFLAPAVVALAAETKPPVKAPAAAASLAGEFSGDWLGENAAGGKLTLIFKPGKESALELEASFTFDGALIPTVTKSLKVENGKIEAVFSWAIQGTSSSTKLVGEVNGDRLEGTYDSSSDEGAAKGKWKVSRTVVGS